MLLAAFDGALAADSVVQPALAEPVALRVCPVDLAARRPREVREAGP